jgi:hypothetical protein
MGFSLLFRLMSSFHSFRILLPYSFEFSLFSSTCSSGGDACSMFEMISPRHTIIVQPDDDDIVFHGARDLLTLREMDPIAVAKEVYCTRVALILNL